MENEDLKKQLIELKKKLAGGVSTVMQTFESKEEKLNVLRHFNPSEKDLKEIYKVAIEKEDYETCDALKDYFIEREIIY